MNYIGSKLSLLEFIDDSIKKVVKGNSHVFCDLFAGTGAVGTYFKKKGYQIIANDIQYYSYVLNRHYVGNHKEFRFGGLEKGLPEIKNIEIKNRTEFVFRYLSDLQGEKGFIYNNYCEGGTKEKEIQRLYFSDENGMRCDAVRQKIEKWRELKAINENEYFFLLTSLIEAVDKCANTASVYGAFLKKLKKTALKSIALKPANLFINDQEHKVFNEDINVLTKRIKGDIVYLDPPYNQRQYASNYHILETIAKYDSPKLKGKTGLREYAKQKSAYCSRPEVKNAFKDLILNIDAKYIFLSYNNEGLMSSQDVKAIMSLRGEYGYFTKEYSRFKADKDENRDYVANKTVEYLHYVVCK
ncbi:MAG: DNA adenine methylase [Candidatus Moraniibacteriota bacterium]